MKTKARGDEPRRADEDSRDRHPGGGEQAGEAIGGIGGTLAGAALGALGGPLGMVLGGVAGALGGWWAGEKAGRAAEEMAADDAWFRSHYDEHPHPDLPYDEARLGYGLGHVAGMNPDWAGLPFEEIEADLRRGWRHEDYDFDTMRSYVRTGYERAHGGRPS